MAIIECNFFSKCLLRSVFVNVTLPLPDAQDYPFDMAAAYPSRVRRYPVLYLLHGLSGDHTHWCRYTNIERYAQEKGLAVVMPAMDNSFCSNRPYGGDYFDFYTQELPRVMGAMFPLSAQREATFIAGLSMGGFGTLLAGFRKPEQYAAIGTLAGRINIQAGGAHAPGVDTDRLIAAAIGELGEYYDARTHDPLTILEDQVNRGARLPEVYMACGAEDIFFDDNRRFFEYASSLGVHITYEVGPGGHNWIFWDRHIQRFLDWLPLDGTRWEATMPSAAP